MTRPEVKVCINSCNISEFRRRPCIELCVTKIIWEAGDLDVSVLKQFGNATELDCSSNKLRDLHGIEVLTKLKVLNCSYNQIVSLGPIVGLNLTSLECRTNWLETLNGIQSSTDLEVLRCSFNRLSSLTEASGCSKLQDLSCSCNTLKSIQVIECFPNLVNLNCSSNPLRSIPSVKGLTGLTTLWCSICELESIESLGVYTSLETLYCVNNKLTSLKGIEACTNLTAIYCDNNKLSTLADISLCSNIRTLNCSHNCLTSLAGIETCTNLTDLFCSYNKLVTLNELSACPHISTLSCSYNELSSIDGISSCTRLQKLKCEHNSITSIDAVIPLTNLTELQCGSNNIASLDPAIYLTALTTFTHDGNPLEIQSQRCQRYLEQFHRGYRRMTITRSSNHRTIYSNNQNVHDVHVQQSVCRSLVHLLADPKPTLDMVGAIRGADIDDNVKQLLVSYCENKSVHSVHMISYEKLLGYVWNRIIKSEHSIELFKILSQQVLDSEGMCFTGRFNRLVSVLVGFYPDIKIEISDTSRISAIILTIQGRITPHDPATHAKTATIELQEAGYSLDEIKPWIDAISDS